MWENNLFFWDQNYHISTYLFYFSQHLWLVLSFMGLLIKVNALFEQCCNLKFYESPSERIFCHRAYLGHLMRYKNGHFLSSPLTQRHVVMTQRHVAVTQKGLKCSMKRSDATRFVCESHPVILGNAVIWINICIDWHLYFYWSSHHDEENVEDCQSDEELVEGVLPHVLGGQDSDGGKVGSQTNL